MFLAAGAYTFQITITKTYNTANLFEDLKLLYKMAGVKGQPVAFIFTCALRCILPLPALSSLRSGVDCVPNGLLAAMRPLNYSPPLA